MISTLNDENGLNTGSRFKNIEFAETGYLLLIYIPILIYTIDAKEAGSFFFNRQTTISLIIYL